MQPDEEFADMVMAAVKTVTAPLLARLIVLEQRAAVLPRDGERGEKGEPGRDADTSQLLALQAEILALRTDLQTKSLDASVVKSEVEAMAAGAIGPVGPAGKDGAPGQSVDMADVAALVVKAVSELPAPKDGRSVTVDDVAPLIASEVTKAVAALPTPKDGVGFTDALIDSEGRLVMARTDGALKTLQRVVGEPGQKGADGAPGLDGKNGRDGTLENIKCDFDGERTMTWLFKDGTLVEGGSIRLDHPRFQEDPYDPSKPYTKGDMVQSDGSGWIALRDHPPGTPNTGSPQETGWKLWIKKGRDVRAAKPPDPKRPGEVQVRSHS